MIDTTKARTDAEEGLRIAEFVTPKWRDEVGYNNTGCPTRFFYIPGNNLGTKVEMLAADSEWAVDSRTRAPHAYRNVIALAEENDRLRAEVARCGKLELYNLRIGSRRLSDLIAMQEKVTALEAEVERLRLALQSSQDQVACYKSREPGW